MHCVSHFNALRWLFKSIVFAWSMLCHERIKVLSCFLFINNRFNLEESLHFGILFKK